MNGDDPRNPWLDEYIGASGWTPAIDAEASMLLTEAFAPVWSVDGKRVRE